MSGAAERPWGRKERRIFQNTNGIVGPFVAEAVDDEHAHLIVRAVNAHEEAIGLLREFVEAHADNAANFGLDEEDCSICRDARALLSRLDAGGTP